MQPSFQHVAVELGGGGKRGGHYGENCVPGCSPGQLHNVQQNDNDVAKDRLQDLGALRFASASTGALLRLLATWAQSSREQGGFKAVDDWTRVKNIFLEFLCLLMHIDECCLNIFLPTT